MSTLQIALILFAVTALGGLAMATIRLKKGTNPPVGLAGLHGFVALSALVTLAAGVLGPGLGGAALWSLILFAGAAVGGFVMITAHLSGKLIPLPILGVHAAAAVVAFVLLLIAAF